MPIYEYLCQCGAAMEEFYKISDRPDSIDCQQCGGRAELKISTPAVLIDTVADVPWLRDFARTRPEARFKKKTIETRQEYKQYLKERDLRPIDGENLSEI